MTDDLPPAAVAFRKYAANKLGLPIEQVVGGPRNEREAALFKERVGSVWAMTMFPRDKPQDAVNGWATQDGTAVTIDQNLGFLLAEAGVWGGGVTPALTPVEIAERITWSLGMNHTLFMDSTLGVPPPEIRLTNGAGTMTFVTNYTHPGFGRAPRQLTRFDIALTKDHRATFTRTAMPNAAAAHAVDREMDITSLNANAKIRVKVPVSWSAGEISVVLRDEYNEAVAGVQFTVICNANCGDQDIAYLSKIVDQTFVTRERPNLNTGDPAMDAVRLKIDVVEQGDVPDGKFRVARITKPADVQGPYREQLYAVCVQAKKGAKVIAAQAWAPLNREKDMGPVIVNACKTFKIV